MLGFDYTSYFLHIGEWVADSLQPQ